MLFLVLVVFALQRDVPTLPEEFSADVTMTMMGVQMSGPYWRSFANQVEKIQFYGSTSMMYYRCREMYLVEQCQSKDMTPDQQMNPMQIPPILSTFIGEEEMEGFHCEHWQTVIQFVEEQKGQFDYWITNTTGVGMYVPVKVIFKVTQSGVDISSTMSFKNLKLQKFDIEKTFIVPKSQCPQAPQDIVKCAHDIFPPVTEKVSVFVLDLSGSMSTQQQTKEGTMTRLAVLKMEMYKILKGLSSKQSFNMIPFDDSYTYWKDEPVTASVENIQDATKYVKSFFAGGSTHIYDALANALNQTDVEAIYFLTDGEPSVYSPAQILAMVKEKEESQTFNIKIHATNFFGSNPQFLQDLADSTGGVFTDIQDGQV